MKARYVRALDGAQAPEDEALTAAGALKDGYRCSGSLLMRDDALPDGNRVNIQDTINRVPDHLRSKLQRVLINLKSDFINVRDDAIHQGHAIGGSLRMIAEGHALSPLVADSSLSPCAVAADHLYAEMAVARVKSETSLTDHWSGIAEKSGVKMRKGA